MPSHSFGLSLETSKPASVLISQGNLTALRPSLIDPDEPRVFLGGHDHDLGLAIPFHGDGALRRLGQTFSYLRRCAGEWYGAHVTFIPVRRRADYPGAVTSLSFQKTSEVA